MQLQLQQPQVLPQQALQALEVPQVPQRRARRGGLAADDPTRSCPSRSLPRHEVQLRGSRHTKTETDRDRQRETETDRDRQRQPETGRDTGLV